MIKVTLKAARVNVDLRQDEAAKLIGVDRKTLQKWEQGITFPDANYIEKICKIYKMPYDNINFTKNNALSVI